jgi:hypothetical protein
MRHKKTSSESLKMSRKRPKKRGQSPSQHGNASNQGKDKAAKPGTSEKAGQNDKEEVASTQTDRLIEIIVPGCITAVSTLLCGILIKLDHFILGIIFGLVAFSGSLAVAAFKVVRLRQSWRSKTWLTFAVLESIAVVCALLLVLQVLRVPNLLTPGNKATPSFRRDLPKDAVKLFFGNSVSWTRRFPLPIIQLRGETMLEIGREGLDVWVSGQFFSRDGKIVAQIVTNKFHVNANNVFRIERTPHRLVVFDNENRLTLDIEYLNPSAIRILGDFYLRYGVPISIRMDEQRVGSIFSEAELGDAGRGVFMFD